jgi:hypothetical protein
MAELYVKVVFVILAQGGIQSVACAMRTNHGTHEDAAFLVLQEVSSPSVRPEFVEGR